MPGRAACWSRNEFSDHREGTKKGVQCKHCNTVVWSVNGSRTKKHLTVCTKVSKETQDRARQETLKAFDLKAKSTKGKRAVDVDEDDDDNEDEVEPKKKRQRTLGDTKAVDKDEDDDEDEGAVVIPHSVTVIPQPPETPAAKPAPMAKPTPTSARQL